MEKSIKDFFSYPNFIMGRGECGGGVAGVDLRLAKSMTQIFGCGMYLVDYEDNKVLYMTDNIARWCGVDTSEVGDVDCDKFVKCVPDEDYKMLVKINEAVFSFLRGMPDDEILKVKVSYNFHLGKMLMLQYFVPVKVVDGNVKVGLFVLTMPTGQSSGNIVLCKEGEPDYYEYSLSTRCWTRQEVVVLTDIERQILWLSAQGRTMDDIAKSICLSVDSVKTYRKRLFKKLDVSNISEALFYCVNHKML